MFCNYEILQKFIPIWGWFSIVGHTLFYFLCGSIFGLVESASMRAFVAASSLPFLFYPRHKPLPLSYKVFWEVHAAFNLLTVFWYLLFLNGFNAYWFSSAIFAALIYGLVASPLLIVLNTPFFIGLAIALAALHGELPPEWVVKSLQVFAVSALATLIATTIHSTFDRMYVRLQIANQRLKELDHAKSEFYQNISHEFRTPLTLILGPLDEILDGQLGPIGEGLRQQAEAMRRNAHRLLSLINQLLDLARIEAKQMTLQAERMEVVSFVRETVATFESLAKRKGIQLEFRVDVEKLEACLDPEKLETILVNLLSNAFKFTESGGRIRCALGVLDDSLELTIQDTGGGIPAEQLPYIFDRFRQADSSTTRKHEGTGIGLSLVREFVELHEGEITATSQEGFGTKFQITLPRNLPPAESGPERTQSPQQIVAPRPKSVQFLDSSESPAQKPTFSASHGSRNGFGGKLLVVEDNKDMQSYICHCLEGHGFQIHVAGNGKEGLEIARIEKPDLILSDVMMPEMDGYQLLQAIRTNRETQHIPVVMLTARASQELKVEGLEAGAIDFLSKPFDRNEVVARVTNLITLRRMTQQVEALNRELAESALKRYLPSELVEKIIAGELQFDEEPRTINATILFSDLVGFTTLSASLRASKTAALLNEYLTAMNEVIFEHCGTVDKFIGDGIMVIFGAPQEMSIEEQSRKATACALHMQARLGQLNEEWTTSGHPTLQMRIGLHQGPVVVGNFGSDKRMEYTAIGSTVNLASRIESASEPGRVYLSGEVCDSLLETEFEDAGSFKLKGVPGEVRLFRLVGP